MDHHHYSPVVENTTHSPTKMGSNNGYVVGGAYGVCNGVDAGIMSSSSKFGKQQLENCHSIPREDYDLSVHQHHTISSTQPLQPTPHHINPKEVAQGICARNGQIKNCSSMDNHPTAQNMIRPDIHSGVVPSHQHHFQLPSHNHQHQAAMITGSTMGGVIVDRDYAPENQMFRTPASINPGGMSSHPYAIPPGESAMPPDSSPTSSSSYGDLSKSFGRKRSRKRPKTCGVCGDRAKSFHFGGLSCDSCKAFFRRSVQNDAHVAFRCAYDSCCDINISTRKSCQFCRFKKCLSIGMEKSWVMTEEERNALNQQRLEKKTQKPSQGTANSTAPTVQSAPPQQQQQQQQQPPSHPKQTSSTSSASSSTSSIPPHVQGYSFESKGDAFNSKEQSALAFQESEHIADVDKMLDYMTAEEQQDIKTVVEAYHHAYKEMPFRVSLEEGRRDTLEIIEMFTTILRRFAYFAKLNADFADINRDDQANLLRAAVLEMCLLRGAACFDTENNRWPSSTMESLKDCPQLRVEDMQRLVSRELFEMHITFIFHMKRLRIDEPIAMLLIMTVLFSPERIPVEDKVKINRSQEKYLLLLKKYVNWKFGSAAGSRIYPQLLTKLSDLRQLNDFHTEFHLNLDRKEVNAIRKSLMELHLNPYPNWKIVPESHQESPEDSQTASPEAAATQAAAAQAAAGGGGIGGMSMPMVTQALIQSFADRRIPTLLDNPYATFETDLGMIRQVQQTLGSLFPSAALLNDPQRQKSTDPGNLHDPMLRAETSGMAPSSVSPRGYSSSTDSTDGQVHDAIQYSNHRQYQTPSVDSSSSSTQMEGTFHSNNEYHSDRFQQFLTRTGQDSESVIKHLGTSSLFSTLQSPVNSGSQPTVLRKHTSGETSLPGTPSSVIRTAPARQDSKEMSRLSEDAHNSLQSINSGGVPGAGWHGGEVTHTSMNGHSDGSANPSAFTVPRSQPSVYDDEGFSDDED